MLGLIMLWGFMDKMFGFGLETPPGLGVIDGGSPSAALIYFDGPFAQALLEYCGLATDILLMAGLLLIGLSLILGMGKKICMITGVIFFAIMYLISFPPSSNLVLDYRLFYIVLMFAIYYGGGWGTLSFAPQWRESIFVKKFPFLE